MDREIITLAFGNYSTLTAAQWVNGTSIFDTEQSVLYMERAGGTVRVPRLLFLDHQQPSKVHAEMVLDQGQQALDGFAGDAGIRTHVDPEGGSYGIRQLPRNLRANCVGYRVEGDSEDEDDEEGEEDGEEAVSSSVKESAETETKKPGDDDEGSESEEKLFVSTPQSIPWYLYIKRPLHKLTPTFLRNSHRDPNGDRLLHSLAHGLKELHAADDEFHDKFRSMLESCDSIQGVQTFLDGDSALGGVGAGVLEHIRDEHDAKLPIFAFVAFPTSVDDGSADLADGDFAEVIRDESYLNRYLAQHYLSEASSVYTPLNLSAWQTTRNNGDGEHKYFCPADHDTGTAQVIAMLVDTALYGARVLSPSTDSFCFRDAADVLRPAPSMRVCSAAAAIPFPTAEGDSLWNALQMNQLGNFDGTSTGGFTPLSHSFVPDNILNPSGLVLSHAFTLRGLGKLSDVTYPRSEALRRYAGTLGTSTYLSTLSDEGYPISGTFPTSVLFKQPPSPTAWASLATVNVASHLMCTHSAARSIGHVNSSASRALKRRRHLFTRSFPLEHDEWRAVTEENEALHDSYNHEEPS